MNLLAHAHPHGTWLHVRVNSDTGVAAEAGMQAMNGSGKPPQLGTAGLEDQQRDADPRRQAHRQAPTYPAKRTFVLVNEPAHDEGGRLLHDARFGCHGNSVGRRSPAAGLSSGLFVCLIGTACVGLRSP